MRQQRGPTEEEKRRNRERAKAALKEAQSLGGSKLDEYRAVKNAVTRNDRFKEVITRGAPPAEDTRIGGGGLAHVGARHFLRKRGPDIYKEKPGGRRGGKGKRV